MKQIIHPSTSLMGFHLIEISEVATIGQQSAPRAKNLRACFEICPYGLNNKNNNQALRMPDKLALLAPILSFKNSL